jgi:hypothetical protein
MLLQAFSHRNYGSKFVVLGYNSTYFSNKIHKGKTCYSEEQVISMLKFVIDNISVSQYFCCPSFTADIIFVRWIDNSFVEQVDDPAVYLSMAQNLYSDSYEYKNKSARRGAQFVPIGMPTTCWNSVPPKETNMFDFSTLYTTLPHDKLKTRLKETIHKAFSHRNYGSKLLC